MLNVTRCRLPVCAVVAVLLGGAAPAVAQFDLRSLFSAPKTATPTPPQAPSQAPAQNGAPREWTGEDGASGHPLMQAIAIRSAPRVTVVLSLMPTGKVSMRTVRSAALKLRWSRLGNRHSLAR